MFASYHLAARADETATLWRCARSLRRSVSSRLPGVRCVSAGSVTDWLALSAEVARDLDLDVFLVFPTSSCVDYQTAFGVVDELIIALSLHYGWRYCLTPSHYRLYVSDASNCYLDVTLIFQSVHHGAVLIDRRNGDTTETGALRWLARGDSDKKMLQEARRSILNFKLWAKMSVPYAIRQNSTVLTAMFTRSWIRSSSPWGSFKDTVTHMTSLLSSGTDSFDVGSGDIRMTLPILARTSDVQRFVRSLETFADELRGLSAMEYIFGFPERCVLGVPVRVFLSSRQRELNALRVTLSAHSGGEMEFLLAEDFFDWRGAVPDGMAVCEARVRAADLFVGVYYREYGDRARFRPTSPIDEEYQSAASQLSDAQMLLFRSADNSGAEGRMVEFLERVERRHYVQRIPIQDIDRARDEILNVIRKQRSLLACQEASENRFRSTPPKLRALCCELGS